MSRHEFAGNGANLAIGWDAPLATFYLQIWIEALQAAIEDEDEDEREAPQVWMGAAYGELPDHRAVLDVARRHVPTIPADFERELMADQLREPARQLAAGGNTVERLLNTLAGQPVVYPTKH